MLVVDALGRRLELKRLPQRIVSLVPSLTEWLFDVGLGARVVAVTDYCIEPAAALASIPRIRGTKNPDRAKIIALQPDLVIADQEENRERDVQALMAAGIPVYVTAIRSVADVPEQYGRLAAVLGGADAAATGLAALHAVLAEAAQRAPQRRIPTLAFIWRDPWMAVGAETYAGDLLERCGAENLGRRLPGRYPRASLETFMRLQPEVILLPNEPYAFSKRDLVAFAPYGDVPAVRDGRVLLCDGMMLTWPGLRAVRALRVFAEAIAGGER
ncbi:MAG: ABC transporter substrate-binding protein [Roseiflexus castenholzii]|uniref:helical backbone metal receptor n=1 Tax=Roseiflexus castenholzii TaxID=120962 RepID=UPI000CC8364F|nr:MAG: ABC transporter substrate-binding protein [Roseiflexus castenholzii]